MPQGLVEFRQDRTHFIHAAGEADFFTVVDDFTGQMTATTPLEQTSTNSLTSENLTGRCSTFMPNISVAMVMNGG